MKDEEKNGTPEEMQPKMRLLLADFSEATGDEMANLLTSWATEDEEEIEHALDKLPRKDRKGDNPDGE